MGFEIYTCDMLVDQMQFVMFIALQILERKEFVCRNRTTYQHKMENSMHQNLHSLDLTL